MVKAKASSKKARENAKDSERPNAALDKLRHEAELLDRESAEARLDWRPAFGYVTTEFESDVGARLRDARADARLTQGELAERTKLADKAGIGLTRNVISFIESGRTQPGPKEIRLLCEALRISPNHLIYGDEDPFDNRMDLVRHGGTSVENFAYIAYCVSKLHHDQSTLMFAMMRELLRARNTDFDAELHREAFPAFIKMARELEELEARRASKKD